MQTTKWKLIVTRRVSVFRGYVMAAGSSDSMQRYIGARSDCLIVTNNELSNYYMTFRDLKSIGQAVIARIQADAAFPQQHINDGLQHCERLITTARRVGTRGQDEVMTPQELKKCLQEYYDVYVSFVKFVVIPIAIEQAITKNIIDFFTAKVGEDKAKIYLGQLMTAPKLPETNQEQLDLAKVAAEMLTKNKVHEPDLLGRHAEQYLWLSCYNIDEEPFSLSYFEARLQDFIKLGQAELSKHIREAEGQLLNDDEVYQRILREFEISGALLGQINLLRQYVWFRSYRIEMQSQANYFVQPLFKEIARQQYRTLREIAALSLQEILRALDGHEPPDHDVLEKRTRSYVFLNEGGEISLCTGDKARALVAQEIGEQKVEGTDTLQGTPAYSGVARGVVRILMRKEQVSEFQEGEVLVTTMTSPEFVPAIRKARALVTDEGGVLCHAAIVAREFKIPCIIGTQKATQIFKDGDTIEVDATTGIVRKLEN